MDFERYVAEKEFLAVRELERGVAGRLFKMGISIDNIARVIRLSVEKTVALIEEYEKKMDSEEE